MEMRSCNNLLSKKILEDKYTVTEKEVNAEYKKYEEQYGDSFESTLSSNNLTKTSFKENLEYNLLVQKATEANMNVSESKLKNLLQKLGNQILLCAIF